MVRVSIPTKQSITQSICRRRILASASSLFIRTRSAGRGLGTLIAATLFAGTFCVLAQTTLFGSLKKDETIVFDLLKGDEINPLYVYLINRRVCEEGDKYHG
jgi:hypothetical protein